MEGAGKLNRRPADSAAGPGRTLISCIVPAFNSARHLPAAIDSILAQAHRPLEVIVADDGSTDETVKLARAYGEPVRVVSHATAGPAATRNLGLRAARGTMIAFLDADDLWDPRKLEVQLGRFGDRPDLECSITHARMFWEENEGPLDLRLEDHPRLRPVPGYATTTMLARRTVFDEVGPLNDQLWFSDATDWFMRARELGIVVELLPDVLTFHRLHAANLTRRRSQESTEEFIHLVKQSLDRRRERAQGGAP